MTLTNAQYAKQSEMFLTICKEQNIKPTSRQASKFRNGKGYAYRMTTTKGLNLHLPKEAVEVNPFTF